MRRALLKALSFVGAAGEGLTVVTHPAEAHPYVCVCVCVQSCPILQFPFPNCKESACNMGNPVSIPELGRSPGEKGMATHSSILARRTPWTEESGRLQSMGLRTDGHD